MAAYWLLSNAESELVRMLGTERKKLVITVSCSIYKAISFPDFEAAKEHASRR
ncbi:hypothetical protein F441_06619 [Phytophthora nicotianae CJ01A1]|uniref:Uncharacterized protein n=6 Tax=Phytophthora nicotianae TaxID=4792 RepID=W2RC61_PHYN3|nr:hypothetical protein PPTG_20965 [Phytophthora nicotianae INRA-310]ETI49595.1 hypothetical protein F443_06608 [Phytophthora nicotianae P1569]ETK89481.1 hypothetical protein L915_06484 [Phytophthora nicotianae]ETO78310.1 hypothetical protein F444_06680 [Phytophthora nicotianae P1976]ETP19360.1 hypothetical protein F441_06619 [Phytophthora nicotianae CJ01A1]ETP47319.1 hypothetical protein F442_06650 [Phytophthora nicotianae P10297]